MSAVLDPQRDKAFFRISDVGSSLESRNPCFCSGKNLLTLSLDIVYSQFPSEAVKGNAIARSFVVKEMEVPFVPG